MRSHAIPIPAIVKITLVAVTMLVGAACGGEAKDADVAAPSTTTTAAPDYAASACTQYADAVRDFKLTTNGEFRDKVKLAYADATKSGNAALEATLADILVMLTNQTDSTRDRESIVTVMNIKGTPDMLKACG